MLHPDPDMNYIILLSAFKLLVFSKYFTVTYVYCEVGSESKARFLKSQIQ